jgi:hypothetical protein
MKIVPGDRVVSAVGRTGMVIAAGAERVLVLYDDGRLEELSIENLRPNE